MAIEIEGKKRRIGLALSGGGFRATCFHLGVFRKLQALGLLWKVDLLSCVSGGSIAGAFLASRWEQNNALDELESYLGTHSIAVASWIGGLLDPFESRIDKLADSYDQDLFHGRTFGELTGPRLYINATNLATGNLFFFIGGGGKPAEMGEHELGVIEYPDFPLSRAVAASSSFPPVFPPVRLDPDVYPPGAAVDYVTLTDGGVYDNMGVNPTVRDRNELDYVILSDAGKPFAFDARPTESSTMVLRAAIDIMMENIRGLEFDRLFHRHMADRGPRPLWFSIDSTEGEISGGDAAFAGSIGTDLKRLSAAEVAVLTRHGGALTESRIRRYAPELMNQ